MRARRVVEGFLVGEHISPFRGGSIEFAQHRAYTPGDEIRYIDWRLLARTDHFHIKQFEVTTNLRAFMLLDSSGSMAYPETVGSGSENHSAQTQSDATQSGATQSDATQSDATQSDATQSKRPSKYEYGSLLVASFSYLLLHQSDAVSLCLNDHEEGSSNIHFLPPRTRATYLHQISHTLENHTPSRQPGILELIQYIQDRVNQRSMCVLISDFFVDLKVLIAKVKTLRAHGHDIILIQVLDPDEINFPFNRFYRFESMENQDFISVEGRQIRDLYLEAFSEHQTQLKRQMQALGLDFYTVQTDQPPEKIMGQVLNAPTRSKKLKALV